MFKQLNNSRWNLIFWINLGKLVGQMLKHFSNIIKSSYKKWKYRLKTRAVLLMFCLNFKCLSDRTGNTSTQQKWLLSESIFSVKMLFELKGYFSQFLLLCQCANAFDAVDKINTDQEDYYQCTLRVIVYIVQSISSITLKRVGY